MPGQALSGLRVLDIANGIAGGYCTKLLAGLGATVVKVEPPGSGDETRAAGPFPNNAPDANASGLFFHLGGGKQSVTLDLHSDGGQAILRELLTDADVLVESERPGTLAAWGLTDEVLAERFPRLIVTSITWFGQTGPYAEYTGSELAAWALGGYLMLTGTPDREPLKGYGSLAQYQGGVQGAVGTMAAISAREQTGRGQRVDVSIAEALSFVLGGVPQAWYFRRHDVRRVGARLIGFPAHGFYPSTLRPCKDGWVHVHTNTRHPDLLAALMEEPRLADPEVLETAYGHADEMDELMDRWLAHYTRDEVVARSQEMRVPNTAVRTPAEVFQDPHLRERDYFVSVEQPAVGPVEQPGPPFRMEATPWETKPSPLLGQDNEAVYVERLGYAPEDLVRMRQQGTI